MLTVLETKLVCNKGKLISLCKLFNRFLHRLPCSPSMGYFLELESLSMTFTADGKRQILPLVFLISSYNL